MKRHLFKDRKAEAEQAGFKLDRECCCGHPYVLWFNSPTGSKEWFILNLADEFEASLTEAKAMKERGE